MLIRLFFLAIFFFLILIASAQIIENFDDGSYTDGNPLTWITSNNSGSSDFSVVDGVLKSKGPSSSGYIYIATTIPSIDFSKKEVVWQFNAKYTGGSPSVNNNIRIYFMADNSNLSFGNLKGYYIQMGENLSGDGIDLYSTQSGKLINDDNNLVSEKLNVTIRVTRRINGQWILAADNTGGNNLSIIDTAINTDYISQNQFGFLVKHTTSNNDNFFFDDISISTRSVQDTISPKLINVDVVNDTTIRLGFSEKLKQNSAQTLTNYRVSNLTLKKATLNVSKPMTVNLTTSIITPNHSYRLNVSDVADLYGNKIIPNTQHDFEYLPIQEARYGDIVINEYLADPVNPHDDFIELYNRSTKNIQLEGWKLADKSTVSEAWRKHIIKPEKFLILHGENASRTYYTYGDTLTINTLTLNNTLDEMTLFDKNNNKIAYTNYQIQPAEGISSELINYNDPCISPDNYIASKDPQGFTIGRTNSVLDLTTDTLSPTLEYSGFSNKELILVFSEKIDTGTVSNNQLDIQNLRIRSIIHNHLSDTVKITFHETLKDKQGYQITIKDISDCSGNKIDNLQVVFGKSRESKFNEIVISEIMTDPTPARGLPEREYIELYNRSDNFINLENMVLEKATGSVTFPNIIINPKTYLILTSKSGTKDFRISNVVGIPNFITLNNSSDYLTLSHRGNLIHSLNYRSDWHDNSEKRNGGFSLEMKDLNNPCSENPNWGSSNAKIGGTPGIPNSISDVIPDNFSPNPSQVTIESTTRIKLSFDEKINPTTIGSIQLAIIPNTIGISNFFFSKNFPKSIFIDFFRKPDENVRYTIEIADVSDCAKNNIQTSKSISFTLPSPSEKGDIIINEILFNPKTGGKDFIELYNKSLKHISFKNWKLGKYDSEGNFDTIKITKNHLIINPHDYLVITTDVNNIMNYYPSSIESKIYETSSMPPFPNDSATIFLVNSRGEIQEKIYYHEDFHYQLLKSTDGVSLERITTDTSINDRNNWRSASSNVGYATPGYKNSQYSKSISSFSIVEVSPKVFIPGDNTTGRNFVFFNYRFGQPGNFSNVNIYDVSGRLIKKILEGALLPTSGFLRWDGIGDNGELAGIGHYILTFEIFDGSGDTQMIKKIFVVGKFF